MVMHGGSKACYLQNIKFIFSVRNKSDKVIVHLMRLVNCKYNSQSQYGISRSQGHSLNIIKQGLLC